MTNRREFLKNTSLVAATGVLAATSVSAATVSELSKINVSKNFGLQIYSLGQELAPDIPGGLKRVREMGYSSIELAFYDIAGGTVANMRMADFKKHADDAGLKIQSSHVGLPIRGAWTRENFEQAKDSWKTACAQNVSMGSKYIIHPGDPPARNSEELANVCEVLNEAGKVAREAGLTFAFHNHQNEYRRVVPGGTERLPFGQTGSAGRGQPPPEGTKMVYDGMIEGTDPSLVQFELDVYWCVIGQQDPVEYMNRYPNRIRLLNIKDRQILGQSGMMNFQKIFETAYSYGVDNFFVELEGYRTGTQFEGVKGCAHYLLSSRFVR